MIRNYWGRESLAAVADQRAQLVKESRQLVKLNAQNPRPAVGGPYRIEAKKL